MWTMPLDEFKVFNPSLSNYAEQLLIANCLEQHGYEWPVPWQDIEFPHPETINSTALRIFNAEIAERYGYHDAPPPNPDEQLAWAEFTAFANGYAADDQFDSRFAGCGDEARDNQTEVDADGLNYIAGLEIQARDQISSDDGVLTSARAWRSCLSKVVNDELPDDPWTQMPTPSMAEKFGIYGPNATSEPTAEEVLVAKSDAECRVSSGYASARYEAEWSAQEELVKSNRDKLDRIRHEAVAHAAELKVIIAENAPSP